MIKKGLTILSILRWLTILVVVGLIVYAIVIFRHSPEAPAAKMERAMVTDLTQVMELCSMEFVEDLPIRGHIGSKNIFARIKLNGNISFDLDSAKAEIRNDTIYVTLPPERVRVTESHNFVRSAYSKGHVKRARKEAAQTVARVVGSFSGAPVVVIDPSPAGYPSRQ